MPRSKKTDSVGQPGPRLVAKSPHAKSTRTAPVKSAPKAVVTHEQVAMRAYELFLQEGGRHGDDLGHWLKAEQELVGSRVTARPAKRVGTRGKV